MKYTVKIKCDEHGPLTPFDVTAKDDDAAVDQARKLHKVPEVGGSYTIEVTCADVCPVYDPATKGMVDRPAGAVVSSFGVAHEPQPSVAEAVYAEREAKRIAAEEAAKVAEIQAAYLDSLGLKLDESGKPVKK